jgi:hypothetical protein
MEGVPELQHEPFVPDMGKKVIKIMISLLVKWGKFLFR